MSASAMTSAITPTATPMVEINEISEMNACLRRASRYRSATKNSNAISLPTTDYQLPTTSYRLPTTGYQLFRPHQGKKDDVADRQTVGQEHDQPIDPQPFTRRRRHPVFERPDVILVHSMSFLVAPGSLPKLILEAPLLLGGIVQLAECIGELEAGHVQLEPFDRLRVIGPLLRERRHLGRKVIDERGLNEIGLAKCLEDFRGDFARPHRRIDVDAQLRCERRRFFARAEIARVDRLPQAPRRCLPRRLAQRQSPERCSERDPVVAKLDLSRTGGLRRDL